MFSREAPLRVDVPDPASDHPSWTKVGIIAALGFAVGIAWPRLTGGRLAPSPPGESTAASAAPGAALAPSAATALPVVPVPAAPVSTSPNSVTIDDAVVVSCGEGKGDTRESCGALALDRYVLPKLRMLAQCPAAASASGKLSLGLELDFVHKSINAVRGRSSTLPRPESKDLLGCAKAALAQLPLQEVPHEHGFYTVFYGVHFEPAKAAAKENKGASSADEATGVATVGWDSAIVRDAPRTGGVVARIAKGTRVKVLGRQNDWCHVRYDAAEHDGWVYRGAVGL